MRAINRILVTPAPTRRFRSPSMSGKRVDNFSVDVSYVRGVHATSRPWEIHPEGWYQGPGWYWAERIADEDCWFPYQNHGPYATGAECSAAAVAWLEGEGV